MELENATVEDKLTDLHRLMDDMQRERDEVRLRLHLARADAKDEWQRLERHWRQLRMKLVAAAREAEETAHDVGAALRLALEELRGGYQRVLRLL